jgi:hypothetical protein
VHSKPVSAWRGHDGNHHVVVGSNAKMRIAVATARHMRMDRVHGTATIVEWPAIYRMRADYTGHGTRSRARPLTNGVQLSLALERRQLPRSRGRFRALATRADNSRRQYARVIARPPPDPFGALDDLPLGQRIPATRRIGLLRLPSCPWLRDPGSVREACGARPPCGLPISTRVLISSSRAPRLDRRRAGQRVRNEYPFFRLGRIPAATYRKALFSYVVSGFSRTRHGPPQETVNKYDVLT